jgi:signal transduction histidine kinase/CheY-like chemotaxis protein
VSANTVSVLLIEDNPGDTRLIQEMLRDSHDEVFTIVNATTLSEGLAHLRETTFDVVLLDLSLPDSFGVDTLVTVHDAHPHTAIVVLTGYADQKLGVNAVQAGAQDYLVKGDTDSKLLVRSLRYAIERHRVDEALRRSEEEYRSLIDDVFDTSVVAVLILDRNFSVVWCNEVTQVYFGIDREHLLGRDKRELVDDQLKCIFADPDDYARKLLDAYEKMAFTDRFECHVLAGLDREERWLEHWSQPIRSGMYAGGRIEQYTDITNRKRFEFAEYEQRQFAEALRDIAALLISTLDLDEVLDRILNNIEYVVPHDIANIMLRDAGRAYIARHRNTHHDTPRQIDGRRIDPEKVPVLQEMIHTGGPVIIGDISITDTWPLLDEVAIDHKAVQAYVGVPITLQDEIMGFINVFSTQSDFFDIEDAERLSAFAEQAAIALQNARLYRKSQELAAIEERQRLARDLHDSVSQTLFTCSAMAESALRQWQINPDRAHDLLQEVHQLSVTALAEMRVLLLELRPTTLTQVSLKQLFLQYLQPIQVRRHLEISLDINTEMTLPPDVQIALYRITQEALNNIDKHAQASHVTISVSDLGDDLALRIRDNGQGFNLHNLPATSLGLGIMRERAEAIGASFEIESQPGHGTCIHVIWPKEHQRRYANDG